RRSQRLLAMSSLRSLRSPVRFLLSLSPFSPRGGRVGGEGRASIDSSHFVGPIGAATHRAETSCADKSPDGAAYQRPYTPTRLLPSPPREKGRGWGERRSTFPTSLDQSASQRIGQKRVPRRIRPTLLHTRNWISQHDFSLLPREKGRG